MGAELLVTAPAAGLVKLMPKLEELYLWTHNADTGQIFSLPTLEHLRILQVDHNHKYPLARLAKKSGITNALKAG